MSDQATEAGVVADLTRKSIAPIFQPDPKNTDIIVFPDKTLRSLEVFADRPRRKRADIKLIEAASFIAYLKAQGSPFTVVFGVATELGGDFSAIIDFHESASVAGVGSESRADWGNHRVSLRLQTTPEWEKWVEKNEEAMSQTEFIEFIEDNMLDIVDPPAADLLDMASNLSGTKTVTFKSAKNLKNGSVEFGYSEAVDGTGNRRDDKIVVPDRITLGLVPFVGANGVKITARLRYRISPSGQLSFAYILDRPHTVIEDAFNVTRSDIETALARPVLLGEGTIPTLS